LLDVIERNKTKKKEMKLLTIIAFHGKIEYIPRSITLPFLFYITLMYRLL